MEREKSLKKIIITKQLTEILEQIYANQNKEFEFYKRECNGENITVDDYIQELIEIAKIQKDCQRHIKKISDYYECDERDAILFYKFTNAEQLMETNINKK